jgi:hypothetical protein
VTLALRLVAGCDWPNLSRTGTLDSRLVGLVWIPVVLSRSAGERQIVPTAPDTDSSSLLPVTSLTQVNDHVHCKPLEPDAMFGLRKGLRKLKRKELAPEVRSRPLQHSKQAVEHTSDLKIL